ncbi:MAG: molecular chaperone HtpG [Clostridia bacterium]|nr:molecular chaperone HtpG [Clostridia bacterium]
MMAKTGNIKISSENMMPIIKKWLYSDKDIFLREIIANGIDAITKHSKLVSMGEATEPQSEYCVKVSIDKKAKTLSVEDNGIGMSEEEVEKYITQIAFSGANDFFEKYEKTNGDGIIGHFGLGFYSAYMVSSSVEIITKSYTGTPAVRWQSDGESTYEIEETDKAEAGTKVVMHILPEEKEFLEEGNIKNLIRKYCSFMPYNIYFDYKEGGENKPVNDTTPLYMRSPKDCTDEDYKKFYTDTFMDYNDPVFWVHLNMDYPINVKGILYFPKVRNKVELERGKVKLYCNRVFIADNIKEVIPEFLMLLNGVIDCPDIPLNVSRSFLQNDKQVQKIAKHITKKVADKLNSLYKKDREKYEAAWDDIANFIKYGCIKDDEFYKMVDGIIIYKDINGNFISVKDAIGPEETAKESAPAEEPASEGAEEDPESKAKTVYYVSDADQQAQYIKMFKDAGLNAICCDNYIDPHFINYIEYKLPDKVKFVRIDADVDSALKGDGMAEDSALIEIFKSGIDSERVTVKTEALRDTKTPAIINVDEYMRRYSEMGAFYGMSEGDLNYTMIVNTANPQVGKIKDMPEDKQKFAVRHIYKLALLAFKKLSPEEVAEFMEDEMYLLDEIAK